MGRKFDIGKYADQLARANNMTRQVNTAVGGETRDIETITAEILQLKEDAGNAILGIGQRLIEVKAILSHGEWIPWLSERVEFSEKTAQNLMRLARQWTNPQILADLGATKALTLLALPPEERETFMAENHIVDGEEKSVIDMTSRELEKAIRERDEALQAAEAAQADARSAEESRAKMEAELDELADKEAMARDALEYAQKSETQARDALAKAQAELKELRERPMDVAVETVVDEEAVKKAREDAIAEMKAKVDKAEAARKAAEDKRKTAEAALADAKKQAEANALVLSRAEKAEAELAEARRALEAAEKEAKASVVNANPDLAMFNVLFDQLQEQVNKMHGLRMKLGKDDKVLDGQLKNALNALSDMVRRCAE